MVDIRREITWVVPACCYNAKKFSVTIPSDDDCLPIDELRNAVLEYSGDINGEEMAIVLTCLEDVTIQAFFEETGAARLDADSAGMIHIYGAFVGFGLDDVYAKYPELNTTYNIVNEDGSESTFPLVTEKHFRGCE